MLDLGKIDMLDIDKDFDQIGKEVINASIQGDSSLLNHAQMWERNILFYQGHQHIRFDDRMKRWEPVRETRFNRYIPRPVDNQILPITQTLRSLLTKNRPNADVQPASDDPMDLDATKLAKRIQDAKWEIDDEMIKHNLAATMLMLCGTVIRKDYWDASAGEHSKALNGPVGDNAVEMIDPFRFKADVVGEMWFMESSIKPLSWVKNSFDREGKGYTGLADKVEAEENLSSMLEIQNGLKLITTNGYGSSAKDLIKDSVVVTECYIAPTANHKRGIMVVLASDKVMWIGESPYYSNGVEDSWHPYSFCRWERNPFSWYGISPVDNLVPLQKRLNAIDALIILNRTTMTSPKWLLPKGCGLDGSDINGGITSLTYNPVGASGAKPEPVFGIPLPGDVYKEREIVSKSMQFEAGVNEVLSGIRPEGVNTAAAMGMLMEQSHSKFNTPLQEWEKFIEKGQTKKLRLIASKYKEPREGLIRRMKAMNKDNLNVEIHAFTGSDIRDNVTVRVEAGSTLPRMKSVEIETYKQAAQMGLFGPLDPVQNPVGNQQFLEKLGLSPIDGTQSVDVERAKHISDVLYAINKGKMSPDSFPMANPMIDIPPVIPLQMKILQDVMKKPDFVDDLGMFARKIDELKMIQQGIQQAPPAESTGLVPSSSGAPMIPQGAPALGGPVESLAQPPVMA